MHHLCEDQTCLDKKFIVFPSEQELKQHVAREHGGNMSRAEKRQALTIPVNFQVPGVAILQAVVACNLRMRSRSLTTACMASCEYDVFLSGTAA